MAEPQLQGSILNDIKKMLGMDPDYTQFDTDVTIFINSVFSTLHQLGVGPQDKPYTISSDSNKWFEFLSEDTNLLSVQTYIYLKVRVLLDPPTLSFVLDAIKAQISEYEWRLTVAAETNRLNEAELEEETSVFPLETSINAINL